MSGLAQIMKIMGFKIQGSDLNKNTNTENCKKLGVKIYQGHQKNLSKSTIVVKSSAIKSNNPEIQEAKKKAPHIWSGKYASKYYFFKKKYYNYRITRKNHYNFSGS